MRTKSTRKFPEIKAFSDILTFGKYRGANIAYVLSVSPSYLLWLHDNTDIKIKQEILQEAWDNEFQRKIRQQVHKIRVGVFSYEGMGISEYDFIRDD